MDKQNVVNPYNGKLFGHKKEWSTDTACYNMDKPWKHYAKWKKTVTKEYRYNFIYMKFLE